MDLKPVFDQLAATIASIPQSGLLIIAVAALVLGWLGGTMARRDIFVGRMLSTGSTLVLCGVLVLIVLQLARLDPRFDVAMSGVGLPEQSVVGGETRVELAPDGHYWLNAEVNGVPARFLVDTGATLTAISESTAQAAGLEPRTDRLPVMMTTANGTISVGTTTVEELRFGNVAAFGLDAVIAPNIGETNVIGMNLLSRLSQWRVEQGTLILVPNNPQMQEVGTTGTPGA
ncbi:retropepsin-like aspartic protease family protein [Alteriqipengyuania lutimaris]|uniref:TIGR02281 family clan AA aspartic protease n=1 Tax=Alteriqipengyuania lutimaris TaxID=1538146 RepID=A0A395LGK7_9SPHN|nr:TIGR02281 family clan AA aspartic protease [Alteriqipengyuania lutimaris]MBB3035442.1 aspartyl protease family protein [Alteriqipengyuania lutimaris]RDS76016.1 TIGR02281 family clan AA aspartic protease [Alteriqipengyuania lutimaris]